MLILEYEKGLNWRREKGEGLCISIVSSCNSFLKKSSKQERVGPPKRNQSHFETVFRFFHYINHQI